MRPKVPKKWRSHQSGAWVLGPHKGFPTGRCDAWPRRRTVEGRLCGCFLRGQAKSMIAVMTCQPGARDIVQLPFSWPVHLLPFSPARLLGTTSSGVFPELQPRLSPAPLGSRGVLHAVTLWHAPCGLLLLSQCQSSWRTRTPCNPSPWCGHRVGPQCRIVEWVNDRMDEEESAS